MPAHHLSFYIRTEYLKKIGFSDQIIDDFFSKNHYHDNCKKEKGFKYINNL